MSAPSAGLGDIDRLVVSPRRAQELLDCGHSHLYELLAARELESFLSGRSRKITVASILAYIDRKIAAAGRTANVTEDTQSRRRGRPRKPQAIESDSARGEP